MNKPLFLLMVFTFVFLNLSCSKFINLGDASMDEKSGDDLPEELSDNENSSGDTGNSGNTGNTGDAGNTGDSGNTGNTGNSGNSGNTISDEEYVADHDSEYSDEEVSDEDNLSLDGYPFSDTFTNDECACGSEPEYAPVCCKGQTSVFNACFANCYSINSSGSVCSEYTSGVCDSLPDQISDDDSTDIDEETPDTDLDTEYEIPDDDSINNECGCYPSDTLFYCCYVNGTVFISKCMADCHCEGGYSNCF